jgi:anti-anti-sigma factor
MSEFSFPFAHAVGYDIAVRAKWHVAAVILRAIFVSSQSAPGAVMKLKLRSDEAGFCRIQTDGEIRLSDLSGDTRLVESLLGPGCYARKILLDMQNTPYMDSSGVSWLVNFHKHCREAGGILVLHSIPPSIMSILKLLHMDRYLNLVEDEQAARVVALGGSLAK